MKRVLKIISKIGVAIMISTSFFYALLANSNSVSAAEVTIYLIGCICVSNFVFMEN